MAQDSYWIDFGLCWYPMLLEMKPHNWKIQPFSEHHQTFVSFGEMYWCLQSWYYNEIMVWNNLVKYFSLMTSACQELILIMLEFKCWIILNGCFDSFIFFNCWNQLSCCWHQFTNSLIHRSTIFFIETFICLLFFLDLNHPIFSKSRRASKCISQHH